MGMRQRYLLGRYYYNQYFKNLILQDTKEDVPKNLFDNLWVASTDVNRTIQSAASEFLGFTHELRKDSKPITMTDA